MTASMRRRIPGRSIIGDVPQSLVLSHQQEHGNSKHYEWLDQFFEDAKGPEAVSPPSPLSSRTTFTSRSSSPERRPSSPLDNARPSPAWPGLQRLARERCIWNSTLLVVLYDEHGGFYDHVEPPAAVRRTSISESGRSTGWVFESGSPRFAVGRSACPIDRVRPHQPAEVPDRQVEARPLTERVSKAQTFADAIRTSGQPRTDTPEAIPIPAMTMAAAPQAVEETEPMNENQKALLAFSDHLAKQSAAPVTPRMVAAAAGPGRSKIGEGASESVSGREESGGNGTMKKQNGMLLCADVGSSNASPARSGPRRTISESFHTPTSLLP